MEKTIAFLKKHPIALFVYGITALLFIASVIIIIYDFVAMPLIAANYKEYATSLSHRIMLHAIGPVTWTLKVSVWLACVLLWYYAGTDHCKKHRITLKCFAVLISVIPGMYIIGVLNLIPVGYDPAVGFLIAMIVGAAYAYVVSIIIKRPGNYVLAS